MKEESIKCFLSFATIPLLKALLFPAAFIFSWPFSFHFERLDRENIKELKSGVLGVGGAQDSQREIMRSAMAKWLSVTRG